MRTNLRQLLVSTRIAVVGLRQRVWLSVSAVFAIALVTFVLIGVLTLEEGFSRTLRNAGSTDVAIISQDGASSEFYSVISPEQQRILSGAPGISTDDEGQPLLSRELYVIIDAVKKSGGQVNLTMRGVDPAAFRIRRNVSLAEGRMFETGAAEIVVGRNVSESYEGFALGDKVRVGALEWTVVGIFAADGSLFESEVWADTEALKGLAGRGGAVQTVHLRMNEPDDIYALRSFVLSDPRLQLGARSEFQYYADQASATATLIRLVGIPLALVMGVGAVANALNTLQSSVVARSAQIATLRLLGFSGVSAFFGTLAEGVTLSLIGGLIGVASAALVYGNLTTSMLGSNFTQVIFSLEVGLPQAAVGLAMACALGFFGSLPPGIQAARQPLSRLRQD